MPCRRLMAGAAAVAAAAALAALPSGAAAAPDPVGCTPEVEFDPSIPTFQQVVGVPLGAGGTGTGSRRPTADLYRYGDALVEATRDNPRVRVVSKTIGTSTLGTRELKYYVISSPANIANLDAGRNDAAFWSGIRAGTIPASEGLAAAEERPAFGWITATPHGNEPAAGEAISRVMYELAARLDCDNVKRLQNLTLFLNQVRNPDGRDAGQRTTAWGFDPNRDFGVRNYKENTLFIPEMNKYPGPFFIDAHQQSSGYFFPPNEDPVHHELSYFSLDFIQNKIGPRLQAAFNDQSSQYRNYNTYDLFTPEYGDSVPSLVMGAAGMTFEKGTSESYGKQVYDHYLAIDETINVTSEHKVELMREWVAQWQEAVDQGAACELQPNKLVSPLHSEIIQQPSHPVCGYFFRPGLHAGDAAKLLKDLQELGVHVYRLEQDVEVSGLREFGEPETAGTLPAGTLYIPMAQPQKHWIQAILGENPFITYRFWYDVVTWSYSLQRGMAGNGFLTAPLPAGTPMTEIGTPQVGTVETGEGDVYAFDTDSMQGLALVADLLARGAKVDRAAAAFDADGVHFETGAALVDRSSLLGIDLQALAAKRNTPVHLLDGYPVEHYALATPRIGLYAGASVPGNPKTNGAHCTSSTAFCEMYFVLLEKMGLPASILVPVTNADLPNLRTMGVTALVNPGSTISDTASLQAFVNAGGRYVAYNANGVTSARNAGLTTLNTSTISGLATPGSTFDGVFDTTSPVAWGFDEGGWIYRDATGNPIFNPATLGDNGKAVVTYGTDPANYVNLVGKYGLTENASGLAGRPAVVETTTGAGRSVLFGFNPFFRSWKEQDERLVLNAILYPLGAPVPADVASSRADVRPADAPLDEEELPATGDTGPTPVSGDDDDVIVTVAPGDVAKVRAAVASAEIPKRWRKAARFRTAPGGKVRLVIPNVRTDDLHDRQPWVAELMSGLKNRSVLPYSAQF